MQKHACLQHSRLRGGRAGAFDVELETFAKCSFLFKFKEGDNFNRRNTLSILRIKI
jgi:hypothetical protein